MIINTIISQQINTNKFNNYIKEDNSINKKINTNINNDNSKEEMNNYEQFDENNNNNFYDNNESELNYLGAEVLNIDEINSTNKKRKNQIYSNKNISPNQSPIPYSPQDPQILKNFLDNKRQIISKKIIQYLNIHMISMKMVLYTI